MFQLGFGRIHVGCLSSDSRLRGDRVGASGIQGRIIGGNVSRGLDVVQHRQHLPLLDPIAFLDIQVRDLGHRVGADVYLHLRLDFT